MSNQKSQAYDHGATAMILILFGIYSTIYGSVMTGLHYGYEAKTNVTSVVWNRTAKDI